MKGAITADAVANNIRLLRTQWRGSVIVCEGSTDARILGRFIDESLCKLEVAHGKDNALEALLILKSSGVVGVLAMVDKDCVLLNGDLLDDPNIVYTDSHDLETMMIQSPALEKVLSEYGSEHKIHIYEKNWATSVRESLVRAATPIGILRLCSSRRSLNLKFEGCNYSAFIDKDTLSVCVPEMAQEIINKTRNHSITVQSLLSYLEYDLDHSVDAWDAVCGHDVTEVLSLSLRKLFGSCNANDVTARSLERSLRLAYERTHFMESRLFQRLKDWEANNPPYRII